MSQEFSRRVDITVFKDEPPSRDQFFALPQNYRADVDDLVAKYRMYMDRFQPYRWHAKGMNGEIVAQGESYVDHAGALNALELLFGDDTTIYWAPEFGDDRANTLLRYGKTDLQNQEPPF